MKGINSAHQYFTQLAGFSPYSINQSSFSDITNEDAKMSKTKIGYYIVDTSSSVYKQGQVDLYITNNISSHHYERPFKSIEPSLYRYAFTMPSTVPGNSIIFLYVKKELTELKQSAIPVYIGKVTKDKMLRLNLPLNEYSYIITDSDERELIEGELVSPTNQ